MKQLQNTIYLTTPGSYLFWQNEGIVVKVGGEEKVRIPAHTVDSILCFGNTSISTPLIAACGERGIGLSFYSDYGKFYGRINGPVQGSILLRQRQFATMQDPFAACHLARAFLLGKLVNCRELLTRAAREQSTGQTKPLFTTAIEAISAIAKQMQACETTDALRGLEGASASVYFSVMDHMIKAKEVEMHFSGRSRRPPEDPFNSLLSFLYTLLKNDVQSALESVGLDPAAGFLHTLRPGRPALALDMMEELRAPMCDRLAIALVNRGQIASKSFETCTAPFHLTDKARKTVLTSWQKRKQEVILHPFFNEKIPIGLIPFAQAQLLARVLRDDLDFYPPFHWR